MDPVTSNNETPALAVLALNPPARVQQIPTSSQTSADGSGFHAGQDRSQAALVTEGLLKADDDGEALPAQSETAESERVLKPYGIEMLPADSFDFE